MDNARVTLKEILLIIVIPTIPGNLNKMIPPLMLIMDNVTSPDFQYVGKTKNSVLCENQG